MQLSVKVEVNRATELVAIYLDAHSVACAGSPVSMVWALLLVSYRPFNISVCIWLIDKWMNELCLQTAQQLRQSFSL